MELKSEYLPSFWLPGPPSQTIWASKFRTLPSPDTKKEKIELDDGDFLNLFWLTDGNGPIVIIVHGLEGDSSSNNVKAMFEVISKIGVEWSPFAKPKLWWDFKQASADLSCW